MNMQLRIVHTSEYVYDGGAMASYNQARMTPVTTPEQIVVHHRLERQPQAVDLLLHRLLRLRG